MVAQDHLGCREPQVGDGVGEVEGREGVEAVAAEGEERTDAVGRPVGRLVHGDVDTDPAESDGGDGPGDPAAGHESEHGSSICFVRSNETLVMAILGRCPAIGSSSSTKYSPPAASSAPPR